MITKNGLKLVGDMPLGIGYRRDLIEGIIAMINTAESINDYGNIDYKIPTEDLSVIGEFKLKLIALERKYSNDKPVIDFEMERWNKQHSN